MEGDQENPNKRVTDGKQLRVKLRIGGKAAAAATGEESPEKKDHVCVECNKRFSSGKSLGGHMSSAHVQASRDYSYKKKLHHLRGGAGDGEDDQEEDEEENTRECYRGKDGKIRCTLCGKKFPSSKSLFGHMRCHPERLWRGMEPPNTQHTFANTKVILHEEDEGYKDDDDEEMNHQEKVVVVDLQTYLWSWAVTDKRGRSPIKRRRTSTNSSSSEEDRQLYGTVYHLVSLVNGDNSRNLQNPNLEIEQKRDNTDKERSSSDDSDDDDEDNYGNHRIGGHKFSSKPYPSQTFEKNSRGDHDIRSHRFSSEPYPSQLYHKNSRGDSRRSCGNLKNMSNSPDSSQIVSKNNKRRIVENKMKPLHGSTMGSEPEFSTGKDVAISSLMDGENNNSAEKFKCSTCNKCFTSHQALGGHRSSHNKFKISIHNAFDVNNDRCTNNSNAIVSRDDGMINNAIVSSSTQIIGSPSAENNDNIDANVVATTSGTQHQCGVCNKGFATRRALGGHKKCHHNSTTTTNNQSSQQASLPEESAPVVNHQPKIFNFDLNEFPEDNMEYQLD